MLFVLKLVACFHVIAVIFGVTAGYFQLLVYVRVF